MGLYGRPAVTSHDPLLIHVEWPVPPGHDRPGGLPGGPRRPGSAGASVRPAVRERERAAVTLVHGFTQNGRCWSPFDRLLAGVGAVATVDLPGHGRSGPATGDLWATGRAVVGRAPAEAHVGYSMGGRVLLHAALAAPEALARLVLIGAHPGIEDAEARHRRREEDERRAGSLERGGLGPFLDEWLTQPLFARLDPGRSHREERLTNDPIAVAQALRTLGTGTQEPLWDRLPALGMPVLFVAGEHDDRYRAVGERTVEAVGANATLVVVPGAGHAAHLEEPGRTAGLVLDWLDHTG